MSQPLATVQCFLHHQPSSTQYILVPSYKYILCSTRLVTAQKISRKLEQNLTVITSDETIYSKREEIQWRSPTKFDDVILRLGGFHIALNFLGVIGTKYAGSHLEDIIIESGVYGNNSIKKILKGKTYNHGVRAQKILFEALTRIRWDSLIDWLVSQDNVEFNTREINQLSELGWRKFSV